MPDTLDIAWVVRCDWCGTSGRGCGGVPNTKISAQTDLRRHRKNPGTWVCDGQSHEVVPAAEIES